MQKFWFCVLLLYTVLADLYLEWWWLHWNYCPFQHTVEFPFFFLSFGITFRSAAWQCVITILFRMPSENLVDLFTYKNYVVYFSEFLGDTKASTILHIPTIFQVERLNNTFFNSSSRNLTFRVPTWVILLYQFLNRGTLQFAYICAVSFSVTNLNLRQQEKHLYS